MYHFDYFVQNANRKSHLWRLETSKQSNERSSQCVTDIDRNNWRKKANRKWRCWFRRLELTWKRRYSPNNAQLATTGNIMASFEDIFSGCWSFGKVCSKIKTIHQRTQKDRKQISRNLHNVALRLIAWLRSCTGGSAWTEPTRNTDPNDFKRFESINQPKTPIVSITCQNCFIKCECSNAAKFDA